MAAYFPVGPKSFGEIRAKFQHDLAGVSANEADGLVFVTNQELTLGEREALTGGTHIPAEIYHLERIVAVLDQPSMRLTRNDFLGSYDLLEAVTGAVSRLEAIQTGGDTFCYWMLYHFDLAASVAQNFAVIRIGEHPLYDVRFRIRDMDAGRDVLERSWGEMNSPADVLQVRWLLPETAYYRVIFHARNGNWRQDLQLRRSDTAGCWLAATRVVGRNGRDEVFSHVDNGYEAELGIPTWLN